MSNCSVTAISLQLLFHVPVFYLNFPLSSSPRFTLLTSYLVLSLPQIPKMLAEDIRCLGQRQRTVSNSQS